MKRTSDNEVYDMSKFGFAKEGLSEQQLNQLNDAIAGLVAVHKVEQQACDDPAFRGGLRETRRGSEQAIKDVGGKQLLNRVKTAIKRVAKQTDMFLEPNNPNFRGGGSGRGR